MSHSRRGRDHGRGHGAGRSEPGREVVVSKALSYILRHAAEREGVKIDSHGYANVADVLAWRKLKSLKVTFPEILNAVHTSDKQRFGLLYKPPPQPHDETTTIAPTDPCEQDSHGSTTTTTTTTTASAAAAAAAAATATATASATAQALAANDPEPSHYLIRATQGHSIKAVEAASLLQRLTLTPSNGTGGDDHHLSSSAPPLPDNVVHGTYHAAWPSILADGGLRCMSRNHIHFATGPALASVLPEGREGSVAVTPPGRGVLGGGAGGVISGMRADAQILIYIDLKRALAAGVPFWRSENGVILSEGVDIMGVGTEAGGRKGVGVEFFDIVVERKNGLGVLWDREKGGLVQETPEWMLKAKNPKGGAGRGGARGKGKRGAPRLRVEGEMDVIGANDI
ncbi:tRNA splicing 2' phosphotransferase 1 [Blastomyces dermatitidis ER-3]|uniref:2'-phosphotransferase n=1 Tax=Ajellomyces dermatitidis (strain ER-3 / ATCC MYA-2586) TaxID=559297 RepID=A0ABP2EKL5_AJEDR|nr:tRNA splicing 2' phosphotransferase 1 [Blastomyces dermatitidis ER-3]EEQ83714.1 tRNA splicing 2' phosphotransferase 1 [Blastomyces dermatitidis ER-3]